MLRIAIVIGIRPGPLDETVARWIVGIARPRTDAEISLLDLAAYALPPAGDVSRRPGLCGVEREGAWSRSVASFDGFVFVTPEYSKASSAALKHAIDVAGGQWRNKAAGFVGYGARGAIPAVEDLRGALAAADAAIVTPPLSLTLVPSSSSAPSFVPDPRRAPEVQALLEQVVAWARALKVAGAAMGQERETTRHERHRVDAPASAELTA
jgi:NAD(P)H-dependent FMN reductase